MDSLIPYFLVDVFVVIAVVVLMFRRMSFWHPLTIYLLFHFYSFTYRLIQILGGAPLMYTGQANAEAITPDEITRAMHWADAALLLFVAASWWAHKVFEAKSDQPVERRVLNLNIAKAVGYSASRSGRISFTPSRRPASSPPLTPPLPATFR